MILTSFGDDEALFDAIMAGAAGYVLKQIRGTERPARQAADLPAGYPLEYRWVVTLRDGRSVLIRPHPAG